jgi:hypothetical protein
MRTGGNGKYVEMDHRAATPVANTAQDTATAKGQRVTAKVQKVAVGVEQRVIAKAERVTAKAAKVIARVPKAPREERAITAVEDTVGARGSLPGGGARTARCVNGQADPDA